MAILSNTEFGILRLTISRAQKRNSINAEMFDTMTEALSRAASDDAVRVVLLQGGEQIFSAGADLEEMRSQPEVLDRAMTNFFAALRAFPKPVVAQVMGPCVGDALSMLLYCDLVYASERALFSLPCVALGQPPRFGSAFIMAAAAGLPRATEKLIEALLPVVDDMERALDHARTQELADDFKQFVDGVDAVRSKLLSGFDGEGVEAIDPKGEAFDCNIHQAVGRVEDASQYDETVNDVYQKGYRMGGKVLRPAMVTVTYGGEARPVIVEDDEDAEAETE